MGHELGRRELALAALLCALGSALLFWSPLFGGRCTLSFELSDPRLDIPPWVQPAAPGAALEPINMLTPDIDLFVLPGMVRIRQLMAQGGSPWWDGGQLCGYPLEANLPSPIFLPTSWPSLLLDAVSALDWLLWLHTAIAALLAWRAARVLGCSPPAAAVAAVGFPLTAWMFTRWHLPHIQYTTAWWPGLVVAAERLGRGQLVRGVAEGGLFLGLALLSGFPQVALAMAAGFALLVVLRPATRVRGPLLAAGAAIALGVALALPQLVVSSAAFTESLRATDAARQATSRQGLRPGALAGVVFPEFFGRPSDFARPDPPAPTLQDWLPQRRFLSRDVQDNPVENALYPGVLVLLLAAAALRPRREPAAVIPPELAARGAWCRMLLLVAGLALLACLAWRPLLALLPGLGGLGAGNTKRLLVLVAGCLPLAAALALQQLLDGRLRVPLGAGALLLLVVIVAPPAAAALDDPQAAAFAADLTGQAVRQALFVAAGLCALLLAARRPGWAWAASLLLLADLASLALAFNPFPRQQPPFPPTAATEALAERPGRIVVFGEQKLLPPTAAATCGIDSVLGVAPMVPTRIAELLGCIEGSRFDADDPRVGHPFTQVASLSHPLLDLLAVDTVVHADRSLAQRSGLTPLFEHEGERIAALERPVAGPRAFLCGGAEIVPDKAARLARLAERDFPIHETVLLEQDPGLSPPLPPSGTMVPVELEGAGVGGAHGRPDQQRLSVDAPFAGILVLSQGWDPGWSVDVDGQAASVLVADHALLGVALPAGQHEVVFRYVPPGLLTSLPFAAAALGVIVSLLRRVKRERRASRGSD